LPVIISGNVGAKDIVKQGTNGFVIDNPEDAEQVAGALELLSDKNIRMKIAAEALDTASHHRWEDAVDKYLSLYEEVIRSKALTQTP
jgi:UDP-glucose:(heptosyl)LPS alpha-1,3-glucosyltransferase